MTTRNTTPNYAELPSITALLAAVGIDPRFRQFSKAQITNTLRDVVNLARHQLSQDTPASTTRDLSRYLDDAHVALLNQSLRAIRPVINATGIVLHTGLGRSALATAAADRVRAAAANYGNVELDLNTGLRGQRGDYAEQLLRQLTGAEAALVVNNNAAATMLVLAALAHNRQVIVSRGQLIEIGGSYRLPEVMSAGGAQLCEVGTTNKTRVTDYDSAVNEHTAMLMHVHTSNYRVVGFSESPCVEELTQLAHHHNLIMFDDLGSGALFNHPLWQTHNEPTVEQSLRAGVDVVAFSGDKLLGGPQAGVLLGKKNVIAKLRKHPMARALRVCKLTLAALEATLEIYLDPDRRDKEIPTLTRLTETPIAIRPRATKFANWLQQQHPRDQITVADDQSFAGGGSLPAQPLATVVVQWLPANNVDRVAQQLRAQSPAVLGRIHDGALVFDFRTIAPELVEPLCLAISKLE